MVGGASMRTLSIIVSVLLLSKPMLAVTVGVTPFAVRDKVANGEQIADLVQARLMKEKAVEVRDRLAVKHVLDEMASCQTGIKVCDFDIGDIDLKQLDVMVFGDVVRQHSGRFLVNVRAVSQHTWTVLYSETADGKDPSEVASQIASRMTEKLASYAAAANAERESEDARFKHRIAIYKIENGNEAAQGVDVSGVLDSILVSAFGSRTGFQVVERTRIQDLLNEKQLSMSGLVQTERTTFEARGISHFLTGNLKVYGDVRVLAYQVINVKTGAPVISDILEWTEEGELVQAMEVLAAQTDQTVFKKNGGLQIGDCELPRVRVFMSEDAPSPQLREIGFCPLIIEDLPAGKYRLQLTHEDRDALLLTAEIKAGQVLDLGTLKMPPVDLTLLQNAERLESAGRYADSASAYRGFYEKYPRYPLASYAMYREGFIVQIYQKRYSEGRKILEEVIRRDPVNADVRTEAYFGIAVGYQEEGNQARSFEILQMLRREYPSSTAAMQAEACLEMGRCPL